MMTASLGGVVGGTVICAICDEVARWRDRETGANPAREVLASLRPALATMPRAKLWLSSSPLGRLDAHAEAFERGDGAGQIVAHAATWAANPTLSEARTRELERDQDVWRREYAAIPLEGTEAGLIAPMSVDRCTRAEGEIAPEPGLEYVAAMDYACRPRPSDVLM